MRLEWCVIGVAATLVGLAGTANAQGQTEETEPDLGWASATELSIVVAEGNAATETFGFKNTVRRTWEATRVRVRFDGVRSKTGQPRVLQVEPGLRFRPGGRPLDFATAVVRPGIDPDVEQYFVEGRVDRDISDRFFWNAGSSWDRNNDAGILNRYIVFGGVGNVWAEGDDRAFSTSYGVSYTNREETELDPEKDDQFGGVRINSDYTQRFGPLTSVDSDLTLNMSLAAASDYSINVTNAVSVVMSDHLSLRVSLQFLYENDPALEDADIVALVDLLDPDGVPGSGDELFETVTDNGTRIGFGTGQFRKDPLDTVLRTALVVSF